MGNMYWFHTIAAGNVTGSLKKIDPLDALGDGTDVPLVPGEDTAIVVGYNDRVIFYKLKELAGQSDNEHLTVIPENNPGDLYWDCQGATTDQLNSLSGSVHNWDTPAYIPEGFTATEKSFANTNWVLWLDYLDSYPALYPQGTIGGAWDGFYYLMAGADSLKINVVSGAMTALGEVSSGANINWDQCAAFNEELGLIMDPDEAGLLHFFDMTTDTYSNITWDDMTLFASKHGTDGWYWGHGYKDKFIYAGGRVGGTTRVNGFSAYDPTYNVLTILPDLPIPMGGPVLIPDPTNNRIMVIDAYDTAKAYIYDYEAQTFTAIADAPYPGLTGWSCGAYNSTVGRMFISMPTNLASYDDVLDVWETHPAYSEAIGGGDGADQVMMYHTEYGLMASGANANEQNVYRVPDNLITTILKA